MWKKLQQKDFVLNSIKFSLVWLFELIIKVKLLMDIEIKIGDFNELLHSFVLGVPQGNVFKVQKAKIDV